MRGIIKVAQSVETLLKEHPHLRDSDDKLLSNVWHKELLTMGKNPNTMTGFELLKIFSSGKLSTPESVTRARRKIQELNPALRGQSYKNRKTKGVQSVIDQIRVMR